MRANRNWSVSGRKQGVLIAIIVSTLLMMIPAAQAKETVIDNLARATEDSASVLVADSHGVLYGTTVGGGATNHGAVFTLTPPAKGQTTWTQTIIYSFLGSPSDGDWPIAGLTPDGQGGFFGTTIFGGNGPCNFGGELQGCGTVYHLTPPAQGQTNWTETVLYSLQGSNGSIPYARVVLDSATGVLYGTAAFGGALNVGVVFSLTPPAQGQTNWTETTLYSFTGTADGGFPEGYLTPDASGALYGTTYSGGTAGYGTVFKLTPPSGGSTEWTEAVLYSFGG